MLGRREIAHYHSVNVLALTKGKREHVQNMQRLFTRTTIFPTTLFVIFLGVTLTLLSTGQRKYESLLRVLSQWDGQHYLSIARDGYQILPCEGLPANFICGNVGWFPLYPLIGKVVLITGIDARFGMLALSWLAIWGALVLLYRLLSKMFDSTIAKVSCVLLLLFPTSFYFTCVFPYSWYLLLTVVTMTLLYEGRYQWLFIPCGMLAATYPSGALIGLPVAYEFFVRRKELSTQAQTYLLVALLAIPTAIVLYFTYYWIAFDDFLLYTHFQGQSYYAHKLSIPLVTLFLSFKSMPIMHPEILAVLFAFGTLILFYTRKLPIGWLLFMLGVLLFTPTFGTTQCYYRHIVVAFPLSVMVALAWQSKRKWLVPVYAIVALWLYVTVYLPQFKLGTLM
jgi:hypothetical protein